MAAGVAATSGARLPRARHQAAAARRSSRVGRAGGSAPTEDTGGSRRVSGGRHRAEVVASVAMPTIEANGLTIGYDVDGAGPPLVLLHGATSTGATTSAALLPPLEQRVPLLHARCARPRPDALGHGRRRVLGRLARGSSLASPTRSGLETFHLLGFSMGAMTALHVAVRRPERAADARRRRHHDRARAAAPASRAG